MLTFPRKSSTNLEETLVPDANRDTVVELSHGANAGEVRLSAAEALIFGIADSKSENTRARRTVFIFFIAGYPLIFTLI